MKELSIEEKARRYDGAIKRLEDIETGKCQKTFMFTEGLFDYIFPELAESEDERIRKMLIEFFSKGAEYNSSTNGISDKDIVAWLEKVEPKFKVGDTVKDPYGDLYHITEIMDDSYKTDDGRFILFKNQEVYTLFKFTAGSEEDKAHIDSLLKRLEGMCKPDATFISTEFAISEDEDWLKSLRPQSQWKPSDEQMDALLVKIPIENSCNKVDNILKSLYSDLKKLK